MGTQEGAPEKDVERIGRRGWKAKGDRSEVSKGRAGMTVLLVLAAIAIPSFWLISKGSSAGRRAGEESIASGPATEAPHSPTRPELPEREPHDGHSADPQAAPPGDSRQTTLLLPVPGAKPSDVAAAFDGRGILRGHVQVRDAEYPMNWTLVIRPSRTLIGREHAVEKRVEFTQGERDFQVEDLPFAGYDVEVQASGLNGRALPVLLRKGNEAPFLNLILVPAGFLEGAITDELGAPQEGVPLTLIGVPEGAQRTAKTDYTGLFRFDDVLDGAYELIVGLPEAPLVKKRTSIVFRAPSMSLPNIELPPLAGLDLRMADDLNRSIEGVVVRGSGNNGGTFTKTSDFDGWVRIRHIPEGRLRLSFSHADYKASRANIELKKGRVLERTWVLTN